MSKKEGEGFRAAVFAWLAAAVIAVTGAAQAQQAAGTAPPSPEQVQRRLGSVQTLIDASSGAKQIDASGNAEAQARQARARERHRQAEEAFRAGDLAGAHRMLDEAAKLFFEGVRLAAPEQVTRGKLRADFDARMESTRALLDAQKRIAQEKGADQASRDLSTRIESWLAEARKLADAGDVNGGRQTLEQAYLAAKAAIGTMRGGDTLVRTLSFASKEEEFRYEIDRNETHKMLVQVLLKGKSPAPTVEAMIRQSVTEAERLRKVADEKGASRDWDAGIKALEESTRSLVRAIRGAGIYIPG